MANKIVKERDWYGEKKSANDIIRRFLASGEGKMFGEISKHLESEGVKYSKKGLHLRLEKLQEEGVIEKKEKSDKSYPTYHAKIKGSDYSGLGWWINYFMNDKLEMELLSLDTKQQLRVMTTLIGVYAILAEIQSWKLASKKKSHKEQFKIRSSFLSQALPLLTGSSSNEFKERFLELGFVPTMYSKNEYRNEMYEYEKILEKSFPIEYKLCKHVFDVVLEGGKMFTE